MRVTVSSRASKVLGNKGKMSVSERQVLEEKRQDLKTMVDPKENESLDRVDKFKAESEIKEIEERLMKDDDSNAKGKDRDVLARRKVELEQFIKENVPTLRIQRARDGTPEYDEALRWGKSASDPKVVLACQEYQDIDRRLNPGDPNAGDIEKVVGW